MWTHRIVLLILIGLVATSCTGIPAGIHPVQSFDINRYLGTWYEIARLDHRFERGLDHVSATYTIRKDGGIDVLNRGYNRSAARWKSAKGKAYFVADRTTGRLKVSFFGPFYSSYNIIALDKINYQYALVCGPNKKYLWILARERTLPGLVKNRLLEQAKKAGFAVEKLIYPRQ